jgi:hypothetical protein
MQSPCRTATLVTLCAALLFPASLLLFPTSLLAQQDIAPLIDQLVHLSEPQVRQAKYLYWKIDFILYEERDEYAEVIQKIVEAGMDGYPQLIEHLDDQRTINIPAIDVAENTAGIWHRKTYDFNSGTTTAPEGVNGLPFWGIPPGRMDQYEITVGDMCYFALGQIVNRRWTGVNVHQGEFTTVSSPTVCKEVKQAVIDEWGALDHKTHREKLIADFRNPDSTDRLIGAYLRLSYYYPADVEKLVLEFLDRPPTSHSRTIDLAKKIAAIDDPAERKNTLATLISENGEQYKDAIECHLFKVISEITYNKRELNRLSAVDIHAKKILHETFGWPKPVTAEQWKPTVKKNFFESELAGFIEHLTHDDSEAIGNRVKQILESDRCIGEEGLVEACFACLASRDRFGNYLADRLKAADFSKVTQNEFSWMHLAAIANSKSPAVIEQLVHITQVTNDEQHFLVAAKAIPSESWQPVLHRIKQMLNDVPADTKDGGDLLRLVSDKSPENAEAVFLDFLAPDAPQRCETVCEALRYNLPLANKILLPMLDDDRPIAIGRIRVRDAAALSICRQIDGLDYNPSWPQPQRDEVIARIKEICKSN